MTTFEILVRLIPLMVYGYILKAVRRFLGV